MVAPDGKSWNFWRENPRQLGMPHTLECTWLGQEVFHQIWGKGSERHSSSFFIIFLEVQCFTNQLERCCSSLGQVHHLHPHGAFAQESLSPVPPDHPGWVCHGWVCPIMSASCRAHMWLCALWPWTSEGFGSLFFHSFPFIPINFHHIISINFT